MKRVLFMVLLGAVAAIPCARAASNRVGTWEIDVAKSNFGSDPVPRSMTVTILEDSAASLAYRVRGMNADQSNFDYEWSGTKDGIPHPVHDSAGHTANLPAAIKEVNGDLVEHGIEPDGMLESSRLSLTPDGQTLTIDIRWTTFEGTEIRRKWCFHRAK